MSLFLERRARVGWFVAGLIAAGAARALSPSVAPGGNFDLTHWKLTLPIGTQGSPTEISPTQLEGADGYTSTYFYTNPTDGSMMFWCPENGVTTSGSTFPRSELREEINGLADDDAEWTINQFTVSQLTATCLVGQVAPSADRVIVGQIHAANFPFIKLVYEYSTSSNTGTLVAQINQDTTAADTEADYTVATNIPLSQQFSYVIATTYSGSTATLTVTVNGNTAKQAVVDESAWISGSGNGMYFKAGNYCQQNGSSSTIGCITGFYALNVIHSTGTPAIATASLPDGVVTVTYASPSLAATGGATPYAWSISSGALPAGLSLSSAGVISGTPTAIGTASFTVEVTDALGQTATQALSIAVAADIPPTLQGVVSQMTQGSAGSYGINLAYTATAAAPATPYPVECRGSGTFSLVLSFNKAIASAQASLAAGTATAGTPVCSGDQVTIPLTGVANAQSLVVDVTNITGTDGSVLAAATVGLRALLGDVNGDGAVNISDINLVRAASGAAVGPSNFQDDLNADGSINISDINLARAASGTSAN